MSNEEKTGPLNIRVEPALTIHGPPDAYKNDTNPRGVFFIANWKQFDSDILEERYGSDVDVENLKSLFSQSGYECVGELLDSTKQELFAALHSLQEKKILKTVDCFVGIFMSHGNQYSLCARNDDEINIEDIIKCFNEDLCPFLEGKPKIFIFQHCRRVAMIRSDIDNSKCGVDHTTKLRYYGLKLRGVSDTYLCHSTLPGEASWRDENGAFYIQALCRVFMKSAKDTEIYSLIGKINRKAEAATGLLYCDFQALGHKYDFYFNPIGSQSDEKSSSLKEIQPIFAESDEKRKNEKAAMNRFTRLPGRQGRPKEKPSQMLHPADDLYPLSESPRGLVYILNNITGCEGDVQILMFIFNQLGYETVPVTDINSYQSLIETITASNIYPSANQIVFYFGYGYDDNLFIGTNNKESLSYKKLCEIFRQKQEKGNALVLFTNTCFKSETPETVNYDELQEPVQDTFHLCVKVDGDCQKGSVLTKALQQEFEDNGSKEEIATFARNVAYKIDYYQPGDRDNYFSSFRCYGINKYFYFISPSEEVECASGIQRESSDPKKKSSAKTPKATGGGDKKH